MKEGKISLGFNTTIPMAYFSVPDKYILTEDIIHRIDGCSDNLVKITAVRWYTNLDHPKKIRPFLKLSLGYNPSYHKKFEQFDCINVDWIADIPYDYDGYMAVPVTFFEHYNPEQFEIIDLCKNRFTIDYFGLNAYANLHKKDLNKLENGRAVYARVIIRKKPLTDK